MNIYQPNPARFTKAIAAATTMAVSIFLLGSNAFGAQHEGEHGGGPRPSGGGEHSFAGRPNTVERSNHGSVRHSDTHIYQSPVQTEHRDQGHREFAPSHGFEYHRDVDVDVHRHNYWNDFAFGHRLGVLPPGYLTLSIGGAPYYYYNGIYYQPYAGGYQEVYPPVGAAVPQPPPGSVEVQAGGQLYYYAGGAFYLQQPDGTFAIAPTPIGVVVPELPPGAVQVSVNGMLAYQFNGIYYQPVFVNGVTQYQTFTP